MTDATKKCFIAMPVRVRPEDEERYGDPDHWLHVLEEIFVPAVEKAGFQAIRPTAQGSEVILSRIVSFLSTCDMVLCDLSGLNPNVLFELGVRTSLNLPITVVKDTPGAPPFDIGPMNAHTYDAGLSVWSARAEIDKLAEHIGNSDESCGGKNPLWEHLGYSKKAEEPDAAGVSPFDAKLELLTDDIRVLRTLVQSSMSGNQAGSRNYAPLTAFEVLISHLRRTEPKGGPPGIMGFVPSGYDSGRLIVGDATTDTEKRTYLDEAKRHRVDLTIVQVGDPDFGPEEDLRRMVPFWSPDRQSSGK